MLAALPLFATHYSLLTICYSLFAIRSPYLRRPEIERWRQFGLWNLDLDLGWIDAGAAINPVGHGSRPEDDDDYQDDLQQHPGDGAPIDLRRLDRWWRDAAQVEQRKAEWRVHEAGLDIGADQ